MKIYIDYTKQLITKVDYDTAYEGDYETVVFDVLFTNFQSTDWYPTMSQLAPNGRSVGDFAPDEEGTDVTEDGVTYKKFTFTCGAGWVMMVGLSNFFVWVNKFVNNKLTKKCVGKVMLKINQSTDGYFVWNPYLNPAVAQYMDELMEGVAHPAGVYTSEQIGNLTSDIGIVVCSTNGYWYYWDEDNNRYTQGAVYQAPFYSSGNKLSSDFVDDTGHTNKFVTANEKAQIATNATNITNLNTNKADKADTYTKTEADALLDTKADRDNTSQTIKAGTVQANSLKASSSIQYTRAIFDTSFYERIVLDAGSENVCCKKFTIPKVSDSSQFAQNWNTTEKAFFQYNDDKRELGKNNTTGIGLGLGQNNNVKPDIQIIPAFRFSNYAENYAKTSALDSLIMFRPYFVFSPLGRIYDMDKAPYVYFGYNVDPYDSTKKSVHLQAHNTSFDVNTKGVELNGSGLHFYENGNQLAYKSAVDSAQSEIDAIKDGTTIDSFADVENELSDLDDDVSALETKVNNLSSVQNVVDVVATKSALDSLSTTNLEQYDKVQVIADETHNGSSTIYEWTGSAWDYVGAYGGNAYTKAQVDALLLEKQDVIDASNKLNSAYINDTNVITISKTISESFNGFIDVNITQSGYISQLDFNKIDKNTKFEWTIYSSVDNTSIQVTARLLTRSVVVNSNNTTTISYTFVGNAVFEGDSTKDINLVCTINVDNDREYQASLRSIIQYNANGVDGMFLTDAEMTALLSEVFN